ncbi:MAG: beta-ketoacyl-ACP synthase [Rhizobiales bacterium]|nr:beta-ketoacyl-ACP synthase [Hyphomicrobiales bacterium]
MSREVWITGIGLTSSLGEGLDAHWQAMVEAEHPQPVINTELCAPYPVHPMVPLDFDKQIPKRGDQRQMENWQRVGVYTAGLALADAGIAGDMDVLSRTHMVVGASGGERDYAVDSAILADVGKAPDPLDFLNERLSNDLRPTLFLAQLPNLVAGNISIVHKVTGSSRTLLGEESAGISAVEVAERRIRAGQGDIFLVGGAVIAERKDSIMILAGGGWGWKGDPAPVWARPEKGGGSVNGSVGAFLVLEAREHAEARGRKPYAQLGPVFSDRSMRRPGEAAANAARQFEAISNAAHHHPLAVITGATGVAGPTREERDFLAGLMEKGEVSTVRAASNMLGTAIDASFASNIALAALALSRKGFYKPTDDTGFEKPLAVAPEAIAVITWGLWRGEGMGLVEAVS